jgi:hypothetical protein
MSEVVPVPLGIGHDLLNAIEIIIGSHEYDDQDFKDYLVRVNSKLNIYRTSAPPPNTHE